MRLALLRLALGLLLVGGLALGAVAQPAPAPKKPAILFCCPGENRYFYVGYDYLQELQRAGFAVDYCEGPAALTWDRVQHYNVLFIFGFPPRDEKDSEFLYQVRPPWAKDYFAVVDRFLKAGGGVFLHYTRAGLESVPNDLLKTWGLQLPLQYLKDPGAERMPNLGDGGLCAFTNQILPSPVSDGVRQLWYPIAQHYVAAHTMPLLIDANWQPVLRAGKSTYTEVPKFEPGGIQPAPDTLIPAEPIKEPVLFAIRDFPGGGRLAAIQQWHQFSIGSGMKWLYNNEVLSKGLANRPSDYGRLLTNTYRWLAASSLAGTALGGFVTDENRIVEPQLRPGAREQLHDWDYQETAVLEYRHPPSQGKLFRGLIGAQTALSGGTGTVADYAKAAATAGLDYVVFLEDLANLTPEKLETLKTEVKQNSTDTLQLIAGYRAKCNTGNYVFIFGVNPPWPEDRLLVGPDKRTLNVQYQDATGKWVQGNPWLDWVLGMNAPRYQCTSGYYNFSKSGNGMRLYDLRVYSMAALRTYEGGKLVEDMTDDYLTTTQSTAVPTPISLNLVKSPQELAQAVAQRQALTYAQARSLKMLMPDALRWNCSYDGLNVFPSDGPLIQAWPRCLRVMTFGAEPFVTGRSMWPSPIHVTADAGLKEIRIYDGQALFRRFICHGEKEFQTTLFFPGVVYHSMVLVAEDVKGGKAVSFAYRSYKEGSLCPIFCSDHVNDGAYMLLAHGTHWPGFEMVPAVPHAGGTWDGGPLAVRSLIGGQFTYPGIATSLGTQQENPYQVPLLEFADEGAVRCRMVSNRVLAKGVPNLNPWYDFGPLEPSPLWDAWASHTYFDQYLTGVEPNAYGAPGVFEGPTASLFTEEFTFKQAMTLRELRVFHAGWRAHTLPRSVVLAVGKGGQLTNVIDLTDTPEQSRRIRLETGMWFGLFSGQPANTHLFINRGTPVLLTVNPHTDYWLKLLAEDTPKPVQAGDRFATEFFSTVWPMSERFCDARTLAEVVAYLADPAGLQLARGSRVAGPGGLLELAPENYAVELTIPKPKALPTLTVPVRVGGFNKRWSVGLYQFDGYRTHYYSKENSGWRALGLDFDGRAYVPLYVSMANSTHVMIGHPLVADAAGAELFIQVTRINDGGDGKGPAWHLSVNNPTDHPITTTLHKAMELPGLVFTGKQLTVQPGEYRVIPNQ